jgi:hypothetical protein
MNSQRYATFWSGTTYQTLVHKCSREQPKTTKELLDITTRHASSEEAVGVVFIQSSGKAALNGGRGASNTATDKGTKRASRAITRG